MPTFARTFALSAAATLAAAAYAQPAATDLGTLGQGETRQSAVPVAGTSIVWFSFEVPAITNDNNRYLDIFTEATAGDSEIGLYDSAGNLIASDDDDGASVRSALSFGAEFPTRPLDGGVAHNGRDGDLVPGTYYLALGNFNTTFLPTAFGVTSASTANNTFDLVLVTGEQVPPADRWIEGNTGDAGDLPDIAQTPQGSGTLGSIAGSIAQADDVDMYEIEICDVASFSATTSGLASIDTQLWLFDANGTGVAFNDDTPPGGVGTQSTLSNAFVTANGTYYLAISTYDRDAVDALGVEIWADTPFGEERAPDGLAAANPVAGWAGVSTASGNYIIQLAGACFPSGGPNCPACAADYDQSGGVDGQDIGAFFNDWEAGAQCADVDGSGGVDGDDIGFFFDRWQAGGCN